MQANTILNPSLNNLEFSLPKDVLCENSWIWPSCSGNNENVKSLQRFWRHWCQGWKWQTVDKFPSGKVLFNYSSSIIVRSKFKVLIEEEGKDMIQQKKFLLQFSMPVLCQFFNNRSSDAHATWAIGIYGSARKWWGYNVDQMYLFIYVTLDIKGFQVTCTI